MEADSVELALVQNLQEGFSRQQLPLQQISSAQLSPCS